MEEFKVSTLVAGSFEQFTVLFESLESRLEVLLSPAYEKSKQVDERSLEREKAGYEADRVGLVY